MTRTPEEILAEQGAIEGGITEVSEFSTEDLADAEDRMSYSDANTDADARTEGTELRNDTMDELVEQAQNYSDEVIDSDEHDRR